jgi:hypothetical protein
MVTDGQSIAWTSTDGADLGPFHGGLDQTLANDGEWNKWSFHDAVAV